MEQNDALKDEYIDHMMNPRNYGKLNVYSAKGIGKNPHNNELVEMYLKIMQNVIVDVKFGAIGCMNTIVTGSIFTEMIAGETLEEAKKMTDRFVSALENAPRETRACGEMVAKAFIAALLNFEHRAHQVEDEYTLMISEECQIDDAE